MKKFLLSALLTLFTSGLYAQVGIGTDLPNPSSQLDVTVQAGDKGVLLARVALNSTADNSTITNGNVESLLVYNTATAADVTPGYYYWYNNQWNRILTPGDIPTELNTTNVGLTTDGVNLVLTDSDGNFVKIPLAELFSETITTLVDNGDGSITYSNEEGDTQTIEVATIVQNAETITVLVNNKNGTYTYYSEDNTVTTVDIPADILAEIQDNTSMVYQEIVNLIEVEESLTILDYNDIDHTLTYEDEDGATTTIDLNVGTAAYDKLTNQITYTAEDGTSTILKLNNTNLSYDDITQELVYINSLGKTQIIDLGTLVAANETLTNLNQDDTTTGDITYTDENNNPTTVDVVSSDATNLIKVGTDGGALLTQTDIQSNINGKDLTAADGSIAITAGGTGATLIDTDIEVAASGITTIKLADGSVTAAKLNQMGAAKNEILRWNGTSWTTSIDSIGWKLHGNTVNSTAFIGTLNNEALRFKQNNKPAGYIDGNLTAFGVNTLSANTTGDKNTAIGYSSLKANTTGSENTAIGWDALVANTTGNNNTAVGRDALEGNETGDHNTAIGDAALDQMVSGSYNTGIGDGVDIASGSNFAAAIGYNSKAGQEKATAIGSRSEANGANATAIGYQAIVEQDNALVLGSIAGKNGAVADTKVGIGTTTPSARLDIGNGKVRVRDLPTTTGEVTDKFVVVDDNGVLKSVNYLATNAVKNVSGTYEALPKDAILLVNAGSADAEITLPDPTLYKGKKYTIKKQDTNEDYFVIVQGNLIGSLTEIYNALPYSGWELVSNGQEWIIVNKF